MVTDIQEVYQEDIGCLEAGDWRERIVTNNTNITPSFNLQREGGERGNIGESNPKGKKFIRSN